MHPDVLVAFGILVLKGSCKFKDLNVRPLKSPNDERVPPTTTPFRQQQLD